ncbi:MAG: MBL fold metallo-hydrolase [Gammaproteobacteria bacterium]|nr:MAG: MBL fold metallo-hydrolase [Gammaproteobacteria bacterium]
MNLTKGAEEIRPGLWRLFEPLGERLLSFYALRHEDGWVLFDAGVPGSLTSRLRQGVWSGDIRKAIISHADADHLGDVASLKQQYPEMVVACHQADRAWVEDHDRLVQERYGHAKNRFGHCYPPEVMSALRQMCGDHCVVDCELNEGDQIDGADQAWCVLHTPGHSPGHVCLWCAETGELLLGDAVLGYGPPDATGKPSMPPTHQYIADYLKTLQRLVELSVSTAMPCHWEPMSGDMFTEFLRQSRETVYRDLGLLHDFIRAQGQASFSELLLVLNRSWGTWGEADYAHYSYALDGYLDYLSNQGCVEISDNGLVVRT